METIGKRIQDRRIALDMTQDDLAKAAKANRTSVVGWEGGRRPSPKSLRALAKALKVTKEWLETGTEETATSRAIPGSPEGLGDDLIALGHLLKNPKTTLGEITEASARCGLVIRFAGNPSED